MTRRAGIIKPGLAIRIGSAIKEINRRRLAVRAASRRQRPGRSRAAIRVRATQFSNSLRLRGSREHPEFGAWWASLNRRIDDIAEPARKVRSRKPTAKKAPPEEAGNGRPVSEQVRSRISRPGWWRAPAGA
jgi:hypothetical protein